MLSTSSWFSKTLVMVGLALSCDALAIPSDSTSDRVTVKTSQLGAVTGVAGE